MSFPTGDDVPQVGIDEISAALSLGVKLLDVREDDEWAAGHIEGAQHIPLGDVPSRMDELDPDAPLWVICHAGGRSQRAAAYLNRNGSTSATSREACWHGFRQVSRLSADFLAIGLVRGLQRTTRCRLLP